MPGWSATSPWWQSIFMAPALTPRGHSQPMQTMGAATELAVYDGARDAYAAAIKETPPEALAYLRPGDDYSLGGLTVHVNFVLEHYLGVLRAMQAAAFAECRPEDPPGLEERALRRARASLTKAEVDAELEATSRLHQ